MKLGIPQEPIMGLVVFILYTNDILLNAHHLRYLWMHTIG